MKKKSAFLVSILLCISMVMTNFAGLGNSLKEAKANGDGPIIASTVSVTVNNSQWGSATVSTGDVTVTELDGCMEGDPLQLKATVANDDEYYFEKWSLTGKGTIENENQSETYFTVGAGDATIQAVFKEKQELNYKVTIDSWAENEEPNEPVVKDASDKPITEGIEYDYYVNRNCEPADQTSPNNSGAEDYGCAPRNPGTYYVRVYISGGDTYKNQIEILEFSVLESVTIEADNKEETYKPGLTYTVSNMFSIPDGAGTPTYEIVANKDNTVVAGAGTIDGDTLTIEKAGTITIQVTTAKTDTVASASVEATLTVNPATLTNGMLKLTPASYIYVPNKTFKPVLSVSYNEQTVLKENEDYVIVADKSATSAEAEGNYTITVKGIGNYSGEASITWKVYEIPVRGIENGGTYTEEVPITVSYADLSSVTLKKDSNEPSSITIQNGVAETTVTDVGSYVLTITDKNGNSVEYKFSIVRKVIEISVNQVQSINYEPGLTYDVSTLFKIPDGAGTPSYEIVANKDNTVAAGAGTIDGGTLTIEKAGIITIKVTTAQTDTVASASAEATLTVNPAKITSNMLKLVPTSYIFVPGTTYEPVLSVYDGQTELIINKDYEIVTTKSDTSASNKGDYKITVKGIGNYTDEEASISWKVYEIPVDGVAQNGVYTNQVSIEVSYADLSSVTLKKDSEEPSTITIQNGVAKITVTDLGKYILTISDKNRNSVEYNFSIVSEILAIEAENDEVTYVSGLTYDVSTLFEIPDGAGTPTYNIVDDPDVAPAGEGTLSDNKLAISKAGKFKIQLTTSGSTYINPGIAYAILTVNKAKGSATIIVEDVVYGSKLNPDVSCDSNADYTLTYKDVNAGTIYNESAPTKVGSYIAIVTYKEKDNYDTTIFESKKFNITAKDITNSSTINVSENKTVFEYDKNVHTLDFTVSVGTITLETTDYEIAQNSTVSATNIGEYTVTINGIGNYKGTNSIKWKISDTKKPVISGTTGNTYLNKAEITVIDDYLDSVTLKNNDNNSVKNDYVKNNGSATITVETPGSYTITATDTSNNQSTYDFVVLSVPNIELVNNIVIKSTEKYNVSGLFKFPEGIGSATYNIVTGNDAGTGEGTLDGQILSITKAGTIKIGVITNREGYVATGSAIGLITGKAITEDQNNQSVQYYLISISYDNIAGSVNNASITYANGSNANFKATPNEGYVFVNWTENGNVIGTSTELSFTVNGARSLSANFAKIINYNPKVEWTVKFPSSFTKGPAALVLKYKITYTSANTGETKTTDEISVTATTSNNYAAGSTDKEVTFTAVADLTGYFVDKEGTKPAENVELSKTYKFKEGSDVSGIGTESGKSESEPEGSDTYNLFYTDTEIRIPLPEGVDTTKADDKAKWVKFYKVESDGTVTVTGDRKKAASAANSLIVLPIMGSDDSDNAVQIGEFQYQLPVFYQKPSLKLSSKSGTVNAKLNVDQELYTTVLEKKSTGVYEPLDLSEQDEKTLWVGKSGTVTAELGDNAGEVKLITKAKATGSIAVKLDNWSDKVELKYTVKASNKNVLTASEKKILMNTAATAGDAQTVTIKINGRDITSEDGVKADLSKLTGKNITVEGVAEDGTLEGSEVSFAYQETAPVKGNYNVTFKTSDGTKVKVTVSVSNAALDGKAVSIKLQTKMDLVSGQKMVLVPTLKAIGGEISEVKLDEAGAALFDCEYNKELNQIYLTAIDASKLNAKDKYTFNVILTVGGVDCKVPMKNVKLTAKKPSVKISKVVVSKSKVVAGTAEAEANVLSTVKQGGKTFTVAPTSVEFNGTKNDDGTWTISDSKKGTATVSYDAETGKIKVVSAANVAGKMPVIKAVIKYNAGVEVKKTISVKVDNKK